MLKGNGEDDGQRITINYHSLWVSFMFVAISHVSHAVSFKIASLMRSTQSALVAGDASQTTPVQGANLLLVQCYTVCCSLR